MLTRVKVSKERLDCARFLAAAVSFALIPKTKSLESCYMFVTFYSYKGGVGRTMALANVACLLAQDRQHPQRVLLIDLDLDAPGLHKLFPPPSRRSQGFVDLAYDFAVSGEPPDLHQYIYHSRVDNVDILPSGQVCPEYCQKLQSIDWPSFFSDDPTDKGAFFGAFVDQINERNYDYVLIDSRTGLSEQAGITTQILPDLVLMLFRLTEQNLDGLSHLHAATKTNLKRRDRSDVTVLPIASLVFSKASREIDERRDRACSIFNVKKLDYIRFDPDLVSDERLFCLDSVREKMWPAPPVIDDYTRLCKVIRQRNKHDTRSVARILRQRSGAGNSAFANKVLTELIRRKPQLRVAWDLLREHREQLRGRLESYDDLAHSILEADPDNAFAHEWMAGQHAAEAKAIDSVAIEMARKSLGEAIERDAKNPRLFEQLAETNSAMGDLDQAISCIKRASSLTEDNLRYQLWLAGLYVRKGRDYFGKSLDLLKGIEGEAKYPLFAYLASFLGSEHDTREALAAVSEMGFDWHRQRGVQAHCLLLQGRIEDAVDIANEACNSTENEPETSDLQNWAEMFLCGEEFDKAIETCERAFGSDDDPVGIIELARYLKEKGNKPDVEEVRTSWRSASWNFTELLLFRERLKRDRSGEYDDCLDVFELIVRDSELHQPVHDLNSVFWRRTSPRFGRTRFVGPGFVAELKKKAGRFGSFGD